MHEAGGRGPDARLQHRRPRPKQNKNCFYCFGRCFGRFALVDVYYTATHTVLNPNKWPAVRLLLSATIVFIGVSQFNAIFFSFSLSRSLSHTRSCAHHTRAQTHWHSFFVLSDIHATTVLAASKGNPLKEPPLVPTILPLPRTNDDVFK